MIYTFEDTYQKLSKIFIYADKRTFLKKLSRNLTLLPKKWYTMCSNGGTGDRWELSLYVMCARHRRAHVYFFITFYLERTEIYFEPSSGKTVATRCKPYFSLTNILAIRLAADDIPTNIPSFQSLEVHLIASSSST